MSITDKEKLDIIIERLGKIEKLIDEKSNPHFYPEQYAPQPVYPTYDPFPYSFGSTVCSKCGMEWKGVMSYSCSDPQCAVQKKPTAF